MIVLGLETSCDDTSAAILKDGRLLSNIISTQLIHQKFGGVVPELASRSHIQMVMPVVVQALEEAKITKEQLEAVAVTCGPGLAGSLLVGLSTAKGLALSLDIPMIGVNHLEGHLMANKLDYPDLKPPLMVLIVSGGHTQIVAVDDWGVYRILGRTRDDAAGEAFDKVAKLLGLGYPGGPIIEKYARDGDSSYIRFPRALAGDNFEFSFSGLKTAVLNHVRTRDDNVVKEHLSDICRCFQDAVIDVLAAKTIGAAIKEGISTIALAGGVAVNKALRKWIGQQAEKNGIEVLWPSPAFCTDNGAMVAVTGDFYLEKGEQSPLSLSPQPSLNL